MNREPGGLQSLELQRVRQDLVSESWEQLTCERMTFMLRSSTAGIVRIRLFSLFFLVIVFLLIACELKFSVYASHKATGLIFMCYMLSLSEPRFLESSVSLNV